MIRFSHTLKSALGGCNRCVRFLPCGKGLRNTFLKGNELSGEPAGQPCSRSGTNQARGGLGPARLELPGREVLVRAEPVGQRRLVPRRHDRVLLLRARMPRRSRSAGAARLPLRTPQGRLPAGPAPLTWPLPFAALNLWCCTASPSRDPLPAWTMAWMAEPQHVGGSRARTGRLHRCQPSCWEYLSAPASNEGDLVLAHGAHQAATTMTHDCSPTHTEQPRVYQCAENCHRG